MGEQAAAAVLDAIRQEGVLSPAVPGRKVQGAEAEQAVEVLRIRSLVAGKIFALLIAEVIKMGHGTSQFWQGHEP